MTRPGIILGGLILAALMAAAWVVLAPLPWSARAFATAMLIPVPLALGLQALLLDRLPEESERETVYTSSAVSIWILAAAAMLSARFSGFSRADLWLTAPPLGTLAAATGLTFASGLVVMVAGRWLPAPEPDIVGYLIPRSGSEKIAFAGLSITAGIAEELVFRSFLIAALIRAFGSTPAAVVASVVVFAVSHAYQGWLGVVRVALLGTILTVPLLVTGSVYPSMAAHAAMDLATGLFLHRWLYAATSRD